MCVDKQSSINDERAAKSPDFCRIFARQLNSFYKLALLLTASHQLAEQCMLATLDEALRLKRISEESAQSWSKRVVITKALQIVRSQPCKADMSLQEPEASNPKFTCQPFGAIIRLHPMERFAFVLSILERISDFECSQFLGCSSTEIAEARMRALELLSMIPSTEEERLTSHGFLPALACNSVTRFWADQARP